MQKVISNNWGKKKIFMIIILNPDWSDDIKAEKIKKGLSFGFIFSEEEQQVVLNLVKKKNLTKVEKIFVNHFKNYNTGFGFCRLL